MSADFPINHGAKYSNAVVVNNIDYLRGNGGDDLLVADHRQHFDLRYDINGVTEAHIHKTNYASAESEVRFLKEWLLLHLDLIQQQNEEILSKERTILILQQENEMLKERVSCMERDGPPTIDRFDDVAPDMTQGLTACEDNYPLEFKVNCNTDAAIELRTDSSESDALKNICEETNFVPDALVVDVKTEVVETLSSEVTYNFTSELDSEKNLRMSIRRKRVCSGSSGQNGSATEDKTVRKRNRRKRTLKSGEILTTPDLYVTRVGDSLPGVSSDTIVDPSNDSVLEVPCWRIKVYASCYSMEGTENLDDEVFNKRHNRLEIDERRRKRWDIQRIREQRVIEKLKQRQERIDCNAKSECPSAMEESLWPNAEDIKFLDVSDNLPVAAFGFPIPYLPPSEFILSWLHDTTMLRKEPPIIKRRIKRRRRRF